MPKSNPYQLDSTQLKEPPKVVVAINSPEPTMEADKIKPGPKNLSLSTNLLGGSLS